MSQLQLHDNASFNSGFVSSGSILFGVCDPVSEDEMRLREMEESLRKQRLRTALAHKLLESHNEELASMRAAIDVQKLLIKKKDEQAQMWDEHHKKNRNGFIDSKEVGLSGVYILAFRERIVYVGQSQNVHARIPQHKNKQFTHFRILPCGKRRRLYWEAVLIKRYNPDYNRKKNSRLATMAAR